MHCIDKSLINEDLNNLDVFEQNVDFKEHMMRILSLLYRNRDNYEVCSEIKELEKWANNFLNKYDIINHEELLKNIDVDYKYCIPTEGVCTYHYTVSVSREVCISGIDKLYSYDNTSNKMIKNIAQGVVINKFANSLINPQLYADKEYTITSISLPSTKDPDAVVKTKTIVQSEEFAKMLKLLNNYGINTYDKLKELLDSETDKSENAVK